jgi:glucosamine 6-phosphate synthetase-like amidotransferase/phosphosugar isomerase protein
MQFPVARGALKLKEIGYIHAEGYRQAEMKHGSSALIDADLPAVIPCAAYDPQSDASRLRLRTESASRICRR